LEIRFTGLFAFVRQSREDVKMKKLEKLPSALESFNRTRSAQQAKNFSYPPPEELLKYGLLRDKEVLEFLHISRSSLWLGVKEGRFPQPIKLSKRTTRWRAQDILALIEGGCNE